MTFEQRANQLLALHLQNQITLLHYLLHFGTCPPHKNFIHALRTSSANQRTVFPPKASPDSKKCRFTPEGGPINLLESTADNSVSADPLRNPEDAFLATTRDLQTMLSKPETLFSEVVASYTSITSGIQSQQFLLYNKTQQLAPCDSDTKLWKNPSVSVVFEQANKLQS